MKQADVVIVEKFHNENKSPQDPKPPTLSESFAKNVDELKKVLGVGVGVDAALTSSNSGNAKNAGARSAPCGTAADNVQSEKEKMQQKLKEVSSYCMGSMSIECSTAPSSFTSSCALYFEMSTTRYSYSISHNI